MSGSELLGGAIGVTMLGLGLASVLAWVLHHRHGDRTLALFGTWCGLYGARLVASQPVIVETLGVPVLTAQYFEAFVTYAINVPVGMFFEALIGPGWKGSVRRVWQMYAAFAVVATAGDLVTGTPGSMRFLNSPLVFIGIVVAIFNLLLYRHRLSPTFRSRVMGVGAAVLLLFVANENLRRPVLPSLNIEPVGVFVFVLTLGYAVVGRAFEQEADLVAVQRELETARRIQASLLPRHVPQLAGLELAAHYAPMSAVAGDLYDLVPLGPSRVGVLVADVSGHGIPAALVASMVKLAFATQRANAEDPARVLTAMNAALCQNMEGSFVTAVYAVVDAEAGLITVANAGHPALLVARSTGDVHECVERGMMIGLTPEADYRAERCAIGRGDRILLYTDGVTEARNPSGEFLDDERLSAWLASTPHSTAAALAERMTTNLKAWRSGSSFDDDVTFVVVRVSAESAVGAPRCATSA